MEDIYPLVLEADALLLASPVYVARLSGYMASFLDRLRVFAHGNHYKGRLTDKVGGALGVGWFRHGGLETTLLILIRFQDEINYVTVSSWPDHEEPISNWWHLHGRSCGKLRTLWNFGKLWRCYCPRS